MSGLHLVRLVLDRRGLLRLAASQRLRARDEGYLLHAGLSAIFAEAPDEPTKVPLHNFVVDETYRMAGQRPDLAFLLGYSDHAEGALRERMVEAGRGMVRECSSRPIPDLDVGRRAAFRVRACPVVRTRQAGRASGPARRRSREVDAWLAHRFAKWEAEPPPRDGRPFERGGAEWLERQDVYGRWLEREVGRGGASRVTSAPILARYERARMYRKGGATIERPDVVLEGELEVADAAAFEALLRRGVGRHRAFGFGCLLLRPA